MPNRLCLVGDIGGTNARFAVAELGAGRRPRLSEPQSFLCADFPCAEDAIDRYLQASAQARPSSAVIALAGPVDRGAAVSTNGVWRLSEDALKAHGFSQARLINDYAALAFGAPLLEEGELATLGPDTPAPASQTLAVLGAGTGFGVGGVARDGVTETPVVTEGGHIAFAPVDEREIAILRHLMERFGRVSVERILSGPGISDLRWALGRIDGREVEPLPADEIARRAETDELCARTLDTFCAIYGSVAGDIALALGARGGVFLGGGIAPRMVERLRRGAFRERFEAKGRFKDYLARIPTRVIMHPYAALLGAAAACPSAELHRPRF